MESQNYLIFSLANTYYGIPTSVIQELFFLPELVPLAEAPLYIIGMVDLRGMLIPVMNLSQRLGLDPSPPQVTDSVVVLSLAGQRLGILVNYLDEVRPIVPEQIQPGIWGTQLPTDLPSSCRSGIAKIDDTVVTLLKPESLLWSSPINSSADTSGGLQLKTWDSYFSLQERQILHDRAKNLRQFSQLEETSARQAIAVFGLRGEYFGIPLDMVSEFANVHKITPIPCCPSHILGNMNLRGEILTLVDIGDSIHLPKKDSPSPQKAVIVRLKDIVVGIAVDQILDIVYIQLTDIKSISNTIRAAASDYLQGVVSYENGMMSLINLPKLFLLDGFVVDESF